MSSLHHARPVDEGPQIASTATATTPAPARGTARHRAGTSDKTTTSKVPTQRLGTAPANGTTSVGSRSGASSSGRSARAAAGSLAAKAKAATAAAAGSTAAKSAAGKAATARTAAAKAASAGATSARTAAARATTAAKAKAKSAAAAKPAAKPKPTAKATATAKPTAKTTATAKPTAKATAPVKVQAARAAEVEVAPATPAVATRPRPTPYPRPASSTAVAVVVDGPSDTPAPVAVVETVSAAAGPVELRTDPAELAPGLPGARRTWLAQRRLPAERRRPAFYLAAGLIGALSMSTMIDLDPPAQAETASMSHSVSVAEQLGIEGGQNSALADPESTRVLQELVVSRNQRGAEQVAAADAQAAADFFALAAAVEAARPKAVSPVDGARLTSGFGARWGTLHAGVDLAAPMRSPEYAVMDGVVLEAGPASGFGLVVYIQHDNGDVTAYGHMDEILVEAGQVVRAGDTIALLGNRGQSTGPHLHFEVHRGGLDGTKVDPLPWLRERGVQI